MKDFSEVFDARKLSQRQLGEIEFVLNSPAYNDTFHPYMRGILDEFSRLWLDRSQKRKDEFPDDFLAGGIAFGEGLLAFFARIIGETSMERIHNAMSNVSNDDLYNAKLKRGELRPVVGLDQSAEPERIDPAEDY